MNRLIIAALMLGCMSSVSFGEALPSAGKFDQRVRNATYIDGQVFNVFTSVLRVTSIEFGPDETIISVVAGDTEGFKVDGVPGGRVVAIKPLVAGISTNMTIYTSRRAYYLNIQQSQQSAYYALRFGGGVNAVTKINAPSKIIKTTLPYAGYGANTFNEITPTKIWDDGVFTYFKFYESAPVPSIFKTQTGPEKTTNSTTTEDGTVRVSGISRYWVLRSGQLEVVVKRWEPSNVQ